MVQHAAHKFRNDLSTSFMRQRHRSIAWSSLSKRVLRPPQIIIGYIRRWNPTKTASLKTIDDPSIQIVPISPIFQRLRWRRCQADDCSKIHGKEKAATVARLENLPSQSRRRYRIDRPVRRPHDFVSAAVRTSGPAAFAAGTFVVGCDGTSKCRMDCPSIN